jgi:uncharacterized protein YegP (UPF0339 family)
VVVYYWHAVASNNKKIAWSGESYHNKADCENGINLMKREAPTAQVVDNTKAGSTGWR